MKKILFVSHRANFSKFNRTFMQWFRDEGWEVSYASDGEEEIKDCDYSYTISFKRFPFSVYNINAYRQLKRLIKKEKFDIIHCHTPVGGVVTRLAAHGERKNGTKIIYTGHGLHFYKGAPIINWLLYYPVERFCAKYTDCLITLNEEDFKNVNKFKFPAKTIEYVPGVGVSLKQFSVKSLDEKRKLRIKFGFSHNDFILVCVAEINKNKNQKFLIKAIQKLNMEGIQVKLLLVGDGTDKKQLEEYVKDKNLDKSVQFLGYVNNVNEILNLSDVLVSASHREGLPVNIIEAMASGLPVVCTDVRGQRELIENGINGYIYSIDDEVEFCNAVSKIRNGHENLELFCENNIKKVQKYSQESVMCDMERIYRRYM